jgi:hypothetical protein
MKIEKNNGLPVSGDYRKRVCVGMKQIIIGAAIGAVSNVIDGEKDSEEKKKKIFVGGIVT